MGILTRDGKRTEKPKTWEGRTTPESFFEAREPWFRPKGNPWVIQAQRGQKGGWDIVLRIDGTYSNHDDALKIADLFRKELAEILEALPRQI